MTTALQTQEELAQAKDVLASLTHLQQLLPLKRRQQALPPPFRMVHREILRSLAETGKPPRQAEIAAMLGSKQSALNALAALGANDLVILSTAVKTAEKTHQLIVPEDVEVVGAYPMTTEKTPHQVEIFGHPVNAMCAVDALSLSLMFGAQTQIASRCHVTGTPIRIRQNGKELKEASPSPEVRVGIRWQSACSHAAHTLCTEMVFLKDAETAATWRATDPDSIELFTLPEAIELGEAFFVPLLED